ncbi:MAG: hypothetical protein AABZ12_13430 [Planctomycetota bacterium]
MRHPAIRLTECAVLLFSLSTSMVIAGTVIPSITYQGQFKRDGKPASGSYDFRFRLFNDVGVIVVPSVCKDNVVVANGLFTAVLDFGAAFDGEPRQLEIAIRPDSAVGNCAAAAGYIVLAPRQTITPAPYALHVLNASGASGGSSLDAADGSPSRALIVDNDGNVGIGTDTPTERLEIVGDVRAAGDVYGRGVLNDNGGVSEYDVTTKRYFVRVDFNEPRNAVLLDEAIVEELCGDVDGCEVVVGRRHTYGDAIGPRRWFVSPADHTWFVSIQGDPGVNPAPRGTDGDGAPATVLGGSGWVLLDGEIDGDSTVDASVGFSLINDLSLGQSVFLILSD